LWTDRWKRISVAVWDGESTALLGVVLQPSNQPLLQSRRPFSSATNVISLREVFPFESHKETVEAATVTPTICSSR